MSQMTTAQQIALALSDRLATITQANGYATEIGLRVYRGRRQIPESCVPCLVLHEEGEEPVSPQLETIADLGQYYVMEGHASCDPDHPNDAGHQIIGDLKRALFDPPIAFGPVQPFVRPVEYMGGFIAPREGGAALVSAQFRIRVTYVEPLQRL